MPKHPSNLLPIPVSSSFSPQLSLMGVFPFHISQPFPYLPHSFILSSLFSHLSQLSSALLFLSLSSSSSPCLPTSFPCSPHPLQVAVLSSPGPILPGHLLPISELGPSQWGPCREPRGPAEWRREGVWAPCMDVGPRRPQTLAASCCALQRVWRLMPVCSQMAPPSLGLCGHHALLLVLGGGVGELEGSLALLCGERGKGIPLSHLGLFPLPLPFPQVSSHPVL